MKKNIFLLALLTVPLFSAQPNPLPGVDLQSAEYFESYDQQVQIASQKPDLILHNDPTFFTGKYYDQDLGAYVFKYRNYSPESNRWTSADPSGFPDGPNNYAYAPVPTSGIDLQGLWSVDITKQIKEIVDPIIDSQIKSIKSTVDSVASARLGTQYKRVDWRADGIVVSATVNGSAHAELVISGGLVNGDATANYSYNKAIPTLSGTVGSGGDYQGYATVNPNITVPGTFSFNFDPYKRIEDAVGYLDVDVLSASGSYSIVVKYNSVFSFYE